MRSLAAPWWSQPTEWAAPSTDWPAGALVLPAECPLSGGTYTVQPWGGAGAAAVGPAANVPGYVGMDFASPVQVTGNFAWFVVACAEYVSTANATGFSLEKTGALGTLELSVSAGQARFVIDNNPGTVMTGDYTVPTLFVAVRIGNQIRSYAAGEFRGTATTGTRTGAITGANYGRNRIGGNNPGRTIGELQGVFPVGLSDDDIRLLATNVWQVYAGTWLSMPEPSSAPVNPTAPGGLLALRGNAPAAAQTHKAMAPGGRLALRGDDAATKQTHVATVAGGRMPFRGAASEAGQVHKATAPGARLVLRGNAPPAVASGTLVAAPGRLMMRGNAPAAGQVHKATAPGGWLALRGNVAAVEQTHVARAPGARVVLRGNAPAAATSGGIVAPGGRLAMRGGRALAVQTHKATAPGGRLVLRGNAPAAGTGGGLGEICDPRAAIWQDDRAISVWQDNYSPIICGTYS